MKKNLTAKTIVFAFFTLIVSIGINIPAFALIRTLTLKVDTDNIESYYPGEGEAFFPEIVIDDEDSELLSLQVTGYELEDADPTRPHTLRFTIGADEGMLDDDLSVKAHSVRASYVDSVSLANDEASGRLMVYPFYRLKAPDAVIDFDSGYVSWEETEYAGRYEIVIDYGDTKSAHFKTSAVSKDISSYIRSSGGAIGVAVRALAPVPGDDEEKYFNIASSEFATAKGSTVTPYTGDYEGEEIFETLGDYESVEDKSFITVAGAGSSASTGKGSSAGLYSGKTSSYSEALFLPPAGFGTFERVSYRWRFLIGGEPYSGGWILIGGCRYYFDSDGFMVTGHIVDSGIDYYLEEKVGDSYGRLSGD